MDFVYIVVAILLIGFLVLVHEIGHFAAARITGVPVTEFAIGFGNRILSRRSEKTGIIYSLRLIPFGGFVAFADGSDETGIANYYKQPVWKRLVVTVSGPLMNFVLAFVLAVFYLMAIGLPNVLPDNVGSVKPGFPAEAAGIQVGDRFIRMGGVDVDGSADMVREIIGKSGGKPIDAVVERAGQQVSVVITPVPSEDGESYLIGITLGQLGEPVRYGLFQSMGMSVKIMANTVQTLLDFLFGLVTQGKGGDQVASPIRMTDEIVKSVKAEGWQRLLDIAIFLSVNLGLFNLLPLPALDGSKVIFLTVEAIRRKPIPPQKESIVTMVGIVLFILLFIFLAGRDIATLLGWIK